MSVGIVLGAGGPLGWAYHLGVLEGVRAAIGHEPADAARIVGTSAGGAIAATLLAGSTTDEVLATIASPPSERDRAEMLGAVRHAIRHPIATVRPQAPRLVRVGGIRSLLGLAPAGLFPTLPLRRFPTDTLTAWPTQLWLPAVRLGDGELVVFGRDRDDVDLRDALEATSAVPLLFRPKTIGDDRYVDGAVVSATHANLLRDCRLDTILVSAPMSRPGSGPIRRRARRQLADEVAELRAEGTPVVVVAPNDDVVAAAEGYPRSEPGAGRAIVDAACKQTIELVNRLT